MEVKKILVITGDDDVFARLHYEFDAKNYSLQRLTNPLLSIEVLNSNDYYAVIPARVTYEQTRNVAYAFKEVFDSNYVEGAYTKIKVQKPAIFQGKWKLIRKGKVELSK